MGQRDVLDCLKKNRCWTTREDLQKMLPFISKQSISESLKRLLKFEDIESKRDADFNHGYKYRAK